MCFCISDTCRKAPILPCVLLQIGESMSDVTISRDDGTEFWKTKWDIGRTPWHEQDVNR